MELLNFLAAIFVIYLLFFRRGLRSNGTETYDNGINMLYLKCFYLGLTLSGTKTYVKV